MKSLAGIALTGALGIAILVAVPHHAEAQREVPITQANRMHPDTMAALLHEPPGGKYKKVSTLVALPAFVPGLGTLYVDPATLPAGPFLPTTIRGTS